MAVLGSRRCRGFFGVACGVASDRIVAADIEGSVKICLGFGGQSTVIAEVGVLVGARLEVSRA
jgi:hypothetical protein